MATGDTLAVFGPRSVEPPSSGGAVLGFITAAEGLRPTLNFDDTVDSVAIWTGVMPEHYDAGGLTIVVSGAMASANTTDDVVLDIGLERVASGDALGAAGSAFATVNSVTQTTDDTADDLFTATITFTNGADMDSIVAGDVFRLKLNRDANNGSDTAVGDFQLIAIHVKET